MSTRAAEEDDDIISVRVVVPNVVEAAVDSTRDVTDIDARESCPLEWSDIFEDSDDIGKHPENKDGSNHKYGHSRVIER